MLQKTHFKKLETGENSKIEDKLVYNISHPHTTGNLAEIIVRIYNQPIKALLDLGATKSVINSELSIVKTLLSKQSPINTSITLTCANGNALPTKGLLNLDIKLNDVYSKQIDVILSSYVSHNLILGTDFIETLQYNQTSDFVHVNNHKIKRFMPSSKATLLRSLSRIVLEPYEVDRVVDISNPLFENCDKQEILVERLKSDVSDSRKFSFPEVYMANSNTIQINLTNLTNEPLLIKKGTPIARILPSANTQVFTLETFPNTDEEREALYDFQDYRREKFDLENFQPPITIDLDPTQTSELESLFKEFNLAFASCESDLGKIAYWRYAIPFYDETTQCYQPPRPIPPGLQDKVLEEFEKWKSNDLVEEAYSSVNIPVLIVKKANGSVRLALDARKLNSLSLKDRFPMPSMVDIFNKIGQTLSGAIDPYISTFDAKRAYNQLLLAESDRHKVAFSLFNKHYTAKRLVYGLQNGPSAFCRLMANLFSDDNEIFCFIDDIIIISKDWQSHIAAIKRLLQKCISIGLVLDPLKCQIAREECTFLGERLTKRGRMPSDKHIKAIKEYPVPTCRKELKRFNGLVVFEQKFIRNASVLMKPLHQLASNKVDFEWTDLHQQSFEAIKTELITTQGIIHRNPNYPLVLTTDASLDAAAGILSQINNEGQYEPLGYFSRVFTSSERRQSSRHREAYAIHDSVRHFEYNLIGQSFLIETDHNSLVWLAKENLQQTMSMRMLNVYEYLASFDFKIKYVPNTSRSIIAADALSRAIDPVPDYKPDSNHEKFGLRSLTHLSDSRPVELKGLDDICRLSNAIDPIHMIFGLEHCNAVQTRAMVSKSPDPKENNTCTPTLPTSTNNGCLPTDNVDLSSTDDESLVFKFGDHKFTRAAFIDKQTSDPFITQVIRNLNCSCQTNNRRKRRCRRCKQATQFALKDGLLYNTNSIRPRLVIPSDLHEEFINYVHVSHLHPGARSLEKIIRSNVFVKNLQVLTKSICARCFTCKQSKPRPKEQVSMTSMKPTATFPFEYCAIDLIDHGKPDNKGFRYLLVINDLLSDFIDGCPLRNKSDQSVSKALLNLILTHGSLSNILTDNGKEFGPLLKSITTRLNMNHIHISPYNSRANRVERSNRCIRIKERLLNLSKSNWSEAWPLIKFHLNNSPKDKLGMKTPFEVAYGRCPYLPYTVPETELLTTKEPWTKVSAQFFNEFYPQLVEFQNARIDERSKTEKFSLKPKDSVLIYKPTIDTDSKISRFWTGPLKVLRKVAPDTYELRCPKSAKIFRRNRRHIRLLPPRPLNITEETSQISSLFKKQDTESDNNQEIYLEILRNFSEV